MVVYKEVEVGQQKQETLGIGPVNIMEIQRAVANMILTSSLDVEIPKTLVM
jgi:hypothetical protein